MWKDILLKQSYDDNKSQKTDLIFSTDDSDADTPVDNPAIETQTVAKARVRSIETEKVFRIYTETVAKARVRS